MAGNLTEENNVITARTYLENSGMSRLPEDYTEEELQKKFTRNMKVLREELDEFDEYRRELDEISKQQADAEKIYSDEELSHEYIYLNRSQLPIQKKYDTAKKYSDYLREYGNEFAQLYHIKDNNEKYGNPEKLDFIEVDITDNGDILTQDQYFKMRADKNERVKQLALHIADESAGVEYNIGMMEYNQPNMPPQVKMQLSFDEETQENLDDEKLNAIFAFCEAHGISVADMEIRNFDGTLAETAIQEKISNVLTQRQADKAAQIAEANAKEYEAQQRRKKALEAELQNISIAGAGHLPEGMVSSEDISYDLPDKQVISATIPNAEIKQFETAGENAAVVQNSPENTGKVHRLAKGVATSAIPGEDVPDNLDAYAPDKVVAESDKKTPEALNSQTSMQTGAINASQSVAIPAVSKPEPKKITQKEAENKFEKFIKEGLGKQKNLSYFKTSTGWFGGGWTEFIIYDSEDKDNRKKDGVKTKDGTVKYTYSCKLFVNVDSDGVLHFAYRVPNHKKIDESVLGGVVGQLKDLGYTAVNFPAGMPKDDEKGMWRKALAEKGLVPIGMGLDKSKAEGMLKAAKEKLSAEDYANYQYRLAKQMNKHNRENGKKISVSEQAFIDGLINTHRYAAFTDAYSNIFKSKIKGILRTDDLYDGAVKKIAAYRTLRKVFDVYKSALDKGGSIADAAGLTPEEKAKLSRLSGSVQKLSNEQMDYIFNVLYDRQCKETEQKLYDELIKQAYSEISVRGAKATPKNIMKDELNQARDSCDSINDDLVPLGVEKVEIIKIPNVRMDFEKFFNEYLPEYNRQHPKQNAGTNGNNNQNTAIGMAASINQFNGKQSEIKDAQINDKSMFGNVRGKTNTSSSAVNAAQDVAVTRNIVQNKTQTYH